MNATASTIANISSYPMDLQFQSYPFLFTFLIFLFTVFKIIKKSKIKLSATNLPPGPWKLPLVGNIHQMIGSLPHQRLKDLAKRYGPLMHLQLGELSTVVISSAELAKEVMKTHDITFATRPVVVSVSMVNYDNIDIAFSPYGDYWRQLRKICTLELLSTKRVQSFRSLREEEVSNLIKSISACVGSPINLSEMIFASVSNIISRATFGKKCQDQEEFVSATAECLLLGGGFNVADLYPSIKLLPWISGLLSKVEKIHTKLDMILENIIIEHKSKKDVRKNTSDGQADEYLIDVLLRVQEDGDLDVPFTTNSIKAVILDMFTAGTETAATTVEWALSELLRNPRLMKKAQDDVRNAVSTRGYVDEAGLDELRYLDLVIKETLRLHPPSPLLVPRECRERCEINGYEIPVKTKVIVNAWAISRDPEYWTDPESFNPERFIDNEVDYKGNHFQYVPFGAGRRICPGMAFGVANIFVQLANLLYHFDWKLDDGKRQEDLDMVEAFGATVRRKNDLYVIPIPYHPSPNE